MSAVLEVHDLNKSFGSVIAAQDINVSVAEHEVVGIIGANGAGKTTFVNMVTGYLKPTTGRILFDGRNITGLHSRDITRMGISRSFQVPQVFGTASVMENLMIALGVADARTHFQALATLFDPRRRDRALAVLERYGIADYRAQKVALLPQGIRKALDIAMAMVSGPRILLLDEPTSGVSVEEKFELMDLIMDALKRDQVTVLFVEHDMEIVERYVHRVLAFYEGRIICDAPPDEALRDPQVRQYVIGEDHGVGDGEAAAGEEGVHA